MTKQEFISELRKKLSNLPEKDAREYVLFYTEMIDDRIEDGLGEEDAVADVGTVEKIYAQILTEVPFYRIVRGRFTKKPRPSGKMIALIASTAIVWAPLLISLIAVALSLYAAFWCVIASLWTAFASLALVAPTGIAIGILNAFTGNASMGILTASSGIVSAGLAIFAFYGCLYSTKGLVILTRKCVVGMKNIILR